MNLRSAAQPGYLSVASGREHGPFARLSTAHQCKRLRQFGDCLLPRVQIQLERPENRHVK
jgi:hypothetical protein